jgi:hypothetical protein
MRLFGRWIIINPLMRIETLLKPILLFCMGVALVVGGCSKGASGQMGPEASLQELNRALQTWVMAKGALPADVSGASKKRLPISIGEREKWITTVAGRRLPRG